MKTILILPSLVLYALVLTISSCKKDEIVTIPLISTSELTNICDTSATSGGIITSNGGLTITASGVCWSTSENPTITDNVTADNATTGNFTSIVKGLKGGNTYYVRAYATNSIGTGYGQSVTLSTIIKNQTISIGAGYSTDVYYSLRKGVIAEVSRTNWDIAFSVSTQSSSIIINESAGIELKVYPTSPGWIWSSTIDITNYASWKSLRNSNTSWEDGAFSQNATGHPNYGWGVYDMTSHNIDGVALYIIKLSNGTYKKIWIEKKYSALQKYSFRYSDINGSNEHIISSTDMNVSNSKANFVYYSIQNNIRLDREPDATTWDLLFTKWEDINSGQPYMVTGVLQNIKTEAIDLTVADPANVTYTADQFSKEINTIGYDWKTINMNTMVYDIPSNRVFIVKTQSGKIYKLNFTAFAGSSTGSLSFNLREL